MKGEAVFVVASQRISTQQFFLAPVRERSGPSAQKRSLMCTLKQYRRK
jgi:hypothetical protein